MEEVMRRALLRSYDLRTKAGEDQKRRGKKDIGNRSQTTSGRHMDEIARIIADDIRDMGVSPDSLFLKNGNTIPGWFRATKRWDVLAFGGDQLIAAIELKTISSSYGKNTNNRVEEAIGDAVDADFAVKRDLLNRVIPPLFAYGLIVKKDEKSSGSVISKSDHFTVDPVFEDASHIDRLRILCERLRRERVYGAVWFVVVDPVSGEVSEPVPELSYDSFLAEIRGKVQVFDISPTI